MILGAFQKWECNRIRDRREEETERKGMKKK